MSKAWGAVYKLNNEYSYVYIHSTYEPCYELLETPI